MNNKHTFNFQDALYYMQSGCSVIGPGGRLYRMDGNVIICHPKPKECPKQKRVETKFTVDAILYEGWTLVNEAN